uniref:ribosomal protein L35 n=1 Tax=Timspurckia oligopyrenoides TaxID=708627 RepID=UPI001FCD8068|nr:ribosomal protein L35 [Timspurckia oligopyrenoides]UNJ17576.1 ribosomal protein L35 [Timspurckia oligopyrenoides]
MPKLKTSKAIAKRFKITRNKKILRRQPFKSHLLEKKSARRKRLLSTVKLVHDTQIESILKQMPYAR